MSRFSALLLERELVSPGELARAQEVCARTGARLPATLARLGILAEGEIAAALGTAAGIEIASGSDLPDEPPRIEGLNPRFLKRHGIIPVSLDDNALVAVAADPEDEAGLNGLRFAAGADRIGLRVATFSDVDLYLQAQFPQDEDPGGDTLDGPSIDDMERLLDGDSEAPVIRLVQRLLAGAVDRRASDVHIEPMARQLAIRYRIDGRLVEAERQPVSLAGPIATRIKVMAGLDIAESRLPQDGRLRLTVRGRDVDVRVSTSPVAYGESIVLRLLGRTEVPIELDSLGLPAPALAALHRALARPHGIILVTGPTGSGKTTTLYAAIHRLRRPEVKILTVEDPVEVLIEGVNQVQVRPEIELSYAVTLRAFLRQDPDILMIGEIRDRETAEIALRAALTGHLVLSTLHTNSAAGAFTRLSDIGIEPYLTASTVIASVAQRLIRALCGECAVARAPSDAERNLFEETGLAAPERLFDPGGCAACGGSGYRARIPLIEVLEVDDALRARIRDGSIAAMEDDKPGPASLLAHGLVLAATGGTSLDEVRRAVEF